MSYGAGSNYADVIEEQDLKKIGKCGELIDKLGEILEENDHSIKDFAVDVFYDGDDIEQEVYVKCKEIYDNIQDEFLKETGLSVELGYHDSDNQGDCYDEVSGYFWHVWDYMVVNPYAKKLKEKTGINIERKHYVTFG